MTTMRGTVPLRQGALRLAEDRLQRVQRAAGVGAFDLDLVTNALLVTPQVAILFGRETAPQNLTFADYEKAIIPDDVAAVRDALTNARQGGVFDCAVRATHPNGGVRWLALSGSVVPDSKGSIRWLRGSCLDVTAQKELELLLSE